MLCMCPICNKVNDDLWVIFKFKGETTSVCKSCSENYKEVSEISFYEKAKLRDAAARKIQNEAVIRNYNLKSRKR